MEVIFLNDKYAGTRDCVATIGFFDGVHRGHQFLVRRVMERADKRRLSSAVVTFDRHPREVLGVGDRPKMLSTLEERFERLNECGLDFCFVVPFNREVSMLSAYDFMRKILREQLNVRELVIGYDNRFGHNRAEDFDDYVAFGKEMGMEVTGCAPLEGENLHISSSAIRRHLAEGEVELANKCLGYAYTLTGRVESGEHEGQKMGFPTANIHVDDAGKMIPVRGVYAVEVRIENEEIPRFGMMNIGKRPTFGDKPTTLEVHVIGFEGNLYGKRLSVSFIQRLRDERAFGSPAQLAEQLKRDEQEVLKILNADI